MLLVFKWLSLFDVPFEYRLLERPFIDPIKDNDQTLANQFLLHGIWFKELMVECILSADPLVVVYAQTFFEQVHRRQ